MSTVTGGSPPKTPPTPVIGSKVRYLSFGVPGAEYKPVPRVAVVTELGATANGKTDVSLCVFNPRGIEFQLDVEFGTQPGQWSWPPT